MVLCGLFGKKDKHSNQVSVKKASSSNTNNSKPSSPLSSSILDREPIRTQIMTLVIIQFGNIHEIPDDFVEYITSKLFEKIRKIGEEDEGQVSISSIPQLYCQIMYKHQRMNNIMKNALKIKAEIEAISFLSERQGEGVPRIVFKISIASGKNSCGNIGIPNVPTSIFGSVSVRGIKLLDLATILDMSLVCDFNSMVALYQESNAFLDNFLYTVVQRFQFSNGDIQCAFQILSESTVSQLDQWRYGSNEERNQYINLLSEINLYFHGVLSGLSKENSIDQTEYINISKILTKGRTPPSSSRSLQELKDYQLGGEPIPWKLRLLQTFSENDKSQQAKLFHINPSLN